MEVKIPEEIALKLSAEELAKYGITKTTFEWKTYATVNLRKYKPEEIKTLRGLLAPHAKGILGASVLMKDIDAWLGAVSKVAGGGGKARTCANFAAMLTEFLGQAPGHRVVSRDGDVWLHYYVNAITYHQAYRESPARVSVSLIYEEDGVRRNAAMSFERDDFAGKTIAEALASEDYFIEQAEHWTQYLNDAKRYKEVSAQIGKQFYAVGTGKGENYNTLNLVRDEEPSRVVVDVLSEEGGSRHHGGGGAEVNLKFWTKGGRVWRTDDEEDLPPGARRREKLSDDDLIEDEELAPVIIPVHPNVQCFDLKRHMRYKVHVSYLTEYKYDTSLGKRLVLPKNVTRLIETLISHEGGFKDIIRGKGGGATILSEGPAGTGKTLTAEVYSEVLERPLYSVQCAQLGLQAKEIEESLQTVFTRAKRWHAIVLLDEADVYIRKRANDLEQNAIVGVFLRNLEYFDGVLFLTTNRGAEVDDAVASRCVARIKYLPPKPEEQAKIWKVLSEVMGIKLDDGEIAQIVKNGEGLSGRDVKQLLKLGKIVANQRKERVTPEIIEFVKDFRPTE